MKKSNKILSAVAAGVLGIMGVAYAATLGTTGSNNVPGDLDVQGGNLDVGVAATTLGTLTLHRDSSTSTGGKLVLKSYWADWEMRNPNGNIWLTTNGSSDFSVNIKNTHATGRSHLTLHDGDLIVRDGDVSIDDGGIVLTRPTGSDALIYASYGGDVTIQLGS